MKTIERLRELEQAATPSPWDNEPYSAVLGDVHVFGVSCDGGESTILSAWGDCEQSKADAVLCAAMRNALPALLAVVEAAARIVAMRSFHGTQDAHEMEYADREDKLATALRALEGGD